MAIYREHLSLIPAYWLGGMATHGLLFGGLIGVWIFARLHAQPFLKITDTLAIPAAVIMGVGRLGNFIDGQIVGSLTTVPWDGRAETFADISNMMHNQLPTLVVYVLGVLGVAYHLANGVQTFAMGWGIVSSQAALRRLEKWILLVFLALLAMGWSVVYALWAAGA